jgi:hypothetical protein
LAAFEHILANHGPGVITSGHFDAAFFSMGRNGMAALMTNALSTATVTPWTAYGGAGVGYEVRMTFPTTIGGTGTYRGFPDVPTNTVLMRIAGAAGIFTVVSAYPIRPGE